MFQAKVTQSAKTHILYPITLFFFENRAVYAIVWKKYGQARLATYDNMAQKRCDLHA
jgi:hypothetical protein